MPALVLGTAQWGLDYGVTNASGRLSDSVIEEILDVADQLGIEMLDTAARYGDAEERIASLAAGYAVATKVNGAGQVSVSEQLSQGLARLGRSSVDRCLLHDWADLTSSQREVAVDALARARQTGLVREIGISVYTEDDLRSAGQNAGTMTVAQVPVNLLDQRLDGSGVIDDLRGRGWTIQARSVLLQGILAAPQGTRFAEHADVEAAKQVAHHADCSLMELALAYIASRTWIDEVVVGVTSADELRQLAKALAVSSQRAVASWSELASMDVDLIDPRRWTR